MENDTEIFTGKTFSSLIKDIYFNSSSKKDQINQLISDLTKLVKDTGSATVIAPMIKDYLDVGVKNDDQLVKLSAVLQRFLSNGVGSDENSSGGLLSDEEKEQLLSSVKTEIETLDNSDKKIKKEMGAIKDKIISDGTQ